MSAFPAISVQDRKQEATTRLLAEACEFARAAERNGVEPQKVAVDYIDTRVRKLARRWHWCADGVPQKAVWGRGWAVRPSRQREAPPSHQAAVTITVAGRVILDADWPAYRRELGQTDPKTRRPYLLDDSTEDLQALLARMEALLEPPAA